MSNYWIVADTHFGHSFLRDHYNWPKDFERRIIQSIADIVKPKDVLIHLGDVCFYNESRWHEVLVDACAGKRWLIRGNHDKKSYSWYIDHGWDMVVEEIRMEIFGANVLLSHKPVNEIRSNITYNIHGHLHNKIPKFNYQKLVATEHTWRPINLRRIIESKDNVF